MFNIQGSELVFLLLIALIVLGPEKLPDAIRKFGRAYSEFKKMANGFQGELKQALDEPMRELRDTADAMRSAANFDLEGIVNPGTAPATTEPPAAGEASAAPAPAPVVREPGLNFGSANPRRQQRTAEAEAADAAGANAAGADSAAAPVVREPGLNFGSANPRRRPEAAAEATAEPVAPPEAAAEPVAPPEAAAEPEAADEPPTAPEGDSQE